MFLYQLLSFFFAASTKEEDSKHDLSLYKRGDLLEVPRTLFTHFGIYLGDNRVAHLIPDILPVISKNKAAIAKMVTNNRLLLGVITKIASVRVDSVADFAYGSEILINHMDKVCNRPPLDGDEVARRAEKLLGSVTYSLLWYNCEHYVMYCRYGMAISYQTYQVRPPAVDGADDALKCLRSKSCISCLTSSHMCMFSIQSHPQSVHICACSTLCMLQGSCAKAKRFKVLGTCDIPWFPWISGKQQISRQFAWSMKLIVMLLWGENSSPLQQFDARRT